MTSKCRHIWRNLPFSRFIDHKSIARELYIVETQTWFYFEGYNNTNNIKQTNRKSINKWRHNDVIYNVKWHFSDISITKSISSISWKLCVVQTSGWYQCDRNWMRIKIGLILNEYMTSQTCFLQFWSKIWRFLTDHYFLTPTPCIKNESILTKSWFIPSVRHKNEFSWWFEVNSSILSEVMSKNV